MKQTGTERRRTVTDEPMRIAPSLLGRTLASPWRRGAAIAIDLALAFVCLFLAAAPDLAANETARPLARPASAPGQEATSGETPRNIILLIGDGMGVGAVTAAWTAHGPLNLGRFTAGGLMTTHAHGNLVTDSAASGTALATGRKTVNGAVSISPAGDTLATLMEEAERQGMATGVVVTCAVTHATPAVFLSHASSRREYDAIAVQEAESGVDVLIGGGLAFFLPETAGGSRRHDSRDLVAALERRMPVLSSAGELAGAPDGPVACLFSPGHPARAGERGIPLGELAASAIDRLSRMGRGFVLMVEGSQIDWAGHDNDVAAIVSEMMDFDGAVGVALDFAERNGSTLVVVTADHETGGMAIHGVEPETGVEPIAGWTTGDHTATMVPIFAAGPGHGRLGGIRDNAEVGRILLEMVRSRGE